MPFISTGWFTSWEKPWGPPLALDGLSYNAGSITYRGDIGLDCTAGEHTDVYGGTVAPQTWPLTLAAVSVTLVFTRSGVAGSSLSISITDSTSAVVGNAPPTVYPAGTTTLVIPVGTANPLLTVSIVNEDYYSPLPIDLTVVDLFASAGAPALQWTNFLGCGES